MKTNFKNKVFLTPFLLCIVIYHRENCSGFGNLKIMRIYNCWVIMKGQMLITNKPCRFMTYLIKLEELYGKKN